MRKGDFARSAILWAVGALVTIALLGWLVSQGPTSAGASAAGPRAVVEAPEAGVHAASWPSDAEKETRFAGRTEVRALEHDEAPAAEIRGEISTLRILLLDRSMLQPIPLAEIFLQQGETTWEGRTDVDGRADAAATWMDGEITLSSPDGRDKVAIDGAASQSLHRILLATGPTYLLDRAALGEVEDVSHLGAVLSSGEGNAWYIKAQLGLDPVPWVRFEWDEDLLAFRTPWRLEVFEEEASRSGSTPIDRILGFLPIPLCVPLVESGSLGVRYLDESGGDLAQGSIVAVGSNGVVVRSRLHPSGNSEMRGVPLGPCTLVARSPGFEEERIFLDVAPGREDLDVVFRQPLPAGEVTGRVRMREGAVPEGLRVRLEAELDWRTREGRVGADGRFHIDAVPAGPWRAIGVVADPTTEPGVFGETTFIAPADGIVLELERLGAPLAPGTKKPLLHWLLQAEDAETGRALDGLVDVWFRVAGNDSASCTKAPIEWSSYAGDVRWALRAPGYRPVFGDHHAFVDEPFGPWGEGRVATARLQPGWGARVRVIDQRRLPLAGVLVLMEGRAAGATDESGLLDIARDVRPRTIGLAGRWRVAPGGMVDPASGAFGDPLPELVIVAEPR